MVTPSVAAVNTIRATARESPPSAKKSSSNPTEDTSRASAHNRQRNPISGGPAGSEEAPEAGAGLSVCLCSCTGFFLCQQLAFKSGENMLTVKLQVAGQEPVFHRKLIIGECHGADKARYTHFLIQFLHMLPYCLLYFGVSGRGILYNSA